MPATLALEVALLAAEVDLLEDLVARGILPRGARRVPTTPELRAGVRFAELDRIVNDAAALIARKSDRVREHVLDGLAEQLGGLLNEADPWAALEQLATLTDPTRADSIPGLKAVVDSTATEIAGDLEQTARAGAAEALNEARRQGIPNALINPVDPVDDAVRAAAAAQAARVAQQPAARLLDVAAQAGSVAATLPGATGASVLEAALNGAEDASRAGAEDLARQSANVTHGLGRQLAQAALPAPSEVYASELLDSSTCGPCAEVDGRTYATLADGLEDYPGAGGYIACDGGSRCRGTLVLVHGTEAPPTQDGPGDGRPGPGGGPADRTPKGPSGVPRPKWIGADGAVIPAPRDVGVPPASSITPAVLDDTGRTVMPVDQAPPITTVPPASVARDAELAQFTDEELDRVLVDAAATFERKVAAADELDQRAAGAVRQEWAEEVLDDATLARYEAEREAWEAAGGYAADASYGMGAPTTAAPAGRAIDRVRQEWADQLHMDYLAAEDATSGVLIRADRAAEYLAKYGADPAALFEGPSRVAYYYASRELRDHWASLAHGRQTFAEFAVDRGVADAKMTARAAKAQAARDDAVARADESAAGQAKRARQKAEKAKRRLPLTEGDRFARDQRRRDRLRAQERQLNKRLDEARLPEDPRP